MDLDARKPVFGGLQTKKSADHPALPRSLISAFFIRLVERIIPRHDTSEIPMSSLVAVDEQAGLKFTLSETPKTGFLTSWPIPCRVTYALFSLLWHLKQSGTCIS